MESNTVVGNNMIFLKEMRVLAKIHHEAKVGTLITFYSHVMQWCINQSASKNPLTPKSHSIFPKRMATTEFPISEINR